MVYTAYDCCRAMKLANYCYTQINLTKVTVDKESQIEKDVYCMILFRESLKEAKLIYGIKFQYGDPLWGRRRRVGDQNGYKVKLMLLERFYFLTWVEISWVLALDNLCCTLISALF